jgi:hypothetical protein
MTISGTTEQIARIVALVRDEAAILLEECWRAVAMLRRTVARVQQERGRDTGRAGRDRVSPAAGVRRDTP